MAQLIALGESKNTKNQSSHQNISDKIYKIFFRCEFCRCKIRGFTNKKKNNKNVTQYCYIINDIPSAIVICDAISCYEKVVEMIRDKTVCCLICNKHPEDNFSDDRFWDDSALTENKNFHMTCILCSHACKIKQFELYNQKRKEGGNITSGCTNCGKEGNSLQKCGSCKVVLYCSRECQIEHWKNGHKETCLGIPNDK